MNTFLLRPLHMYPHTSKCSQPPKRHRGQGNLTNVPFLASSLQLLSPASRLGYAWLTVIFEVWVGETAQDVPPELAGFPFPSRYESPAATFAILCVLYCTLQ